VTTTKRHRVLLPAGAISARKLALPIVWSIVLLAASCFLVLERVGGSNFGRPGAWILVVMPIVGAAAFALLVISARAALMARRRLPLAILYTTDNGRIVTSVWRDVMHLGGNHASGELQVDVLYGMVQGRSPRARGTYSVTVRLLASGNSVLRVSGPAGDATPDWESWTSEAFGPDVSPDVVVRHV
jgi:hypothetical protein